MACCKAFAKIYLVALNILVALCGLGMLGGAAYLRIAFEDFAELFTEEGIYVAMGAGGLVFLISFVGCVGALKHNKWLLIIYSIVMFVAIMAQLTAGTMILVSLGYMNDVAVDAVGTITNSVTRGINDYELAAWENCCLEAYPAVWVPPGGDGADEMVLPCASASASEQQACYYSSDSVFEDTYLTWATKGLCSTLGELKLASGDALVANPLEYSDSCGGYEGGDGTPDAETYAKHAQASQAQFQVNTNQWFEDNAKPIGIGALIVTAVEILAFLFTCVLLCANREDYDAEYQRRLNAEQEMTAGSITGTSECPRASCRTRTRHHFFDSRSRGACVRRGWILEADGVRLKTLAPS